MANVLPLGPRQPQVPTSSSLRGWLITALNSRGERPRAAGPGFRTSEAECIAAGPYSGVFHLQSHALPCLGVFMPTLGHPWASSTFLRDESLGAGGRRPGFSSWACHLLALWPWARTYSLCFSFLTCKMGTKIGLTSQSWREAHSMITQFSSHSKPGRWKFHPCCSGRNRGWVMWNDTGRGCGVGEPGMGVGGFKF